ncbi:MAG TPA: MFS transporter, partial [Hyphomicrobiales bacterium]|nr:MFS transporter [Hyphomicrobiales bacterium]
MFLIVRSVWTLFFALALIMVGNGLQGSLLGLRAGIEGFTTPEIGLVMSAYYGGFLLASAVMPRLITDVGHIRVSVGFAAVATAAVLLHALFPNPPTWLFLRFLTGVALAGFYVVAESWLNAAASNDNRGRLLAFYMTANFACLAGGQYLLAFIDPGSFEPFMIIAILISLAIVPISLTPTVTPQLQQFERVGLRELYAISPLGFGTCLLVGVSQGALLGMGAVYGAAIGLATEQIALMMSLPFLAVIVTQFPIGFIADRFDRRHVILVLNLVVGAFALLAMAPGPEHLFFLLILFTAYGSLAAPVYSLAIAHANDNLAPGKLLGASAQLVFVFGAGSVFGPLLAGLVMNALGPWALFGLFAAAHFSIAGFAAYRMTRRPPVPPEERGEFVTVMVRATPVAASA